ncbi:hypothetical protein FHS96_005111 [Sphingomonas zeicaulis]
MFEPRDLLTLVLLGGALAAIAAILGLGRSQGWLHARWIVVTVLAAPPALLAAGVMELRRATPLIDLRWLTHGDVWRFAGAVFLIRLVLAEQEMALGAMRGVGAPPHEFESLAVVMLASAVTGVLASTMCVNFEKIARPMMLAIGIVTVAALVDGIGTGPLPMASLYASQSAIAFAGTFFLGPALLLGIMSALRQGSGALLSFIVLFGVVNALGALAGQALFGSYMDWRLAAGAAEQAARSDTMRLAAVLGLATTLYLAVLFLLRVRRRLAELRTETGAGAASKEVAPAAGSGWTQPRRSGDRSDHRGAGDRGCDLDLGSVRTGLTCASDFAVEPLVEKVDECPHPCDTGACRRHENLQVAPLVREVWQHHLELAACQRLFNHELGHEHDA